MRHLLNIIDKIYQTEYIIKKKSASALQELMAVMDGCNWWLKVMAASDVCKLQKGNIGWKWWVQLMAACLLVPLPVEDFQFQTSGMFLKNTTSSANKTVLDEDM